MILFLIMASVVYVLYLTAMAGKPDAKLDVISATCIKYASGMSDEVLGLGIIFALIISIAGYVAAAIYLATVMLSLATIRSAIQKAALAAAVEEHGKTDGRGSE